MRATVDDVHQWHWQRHLTGATQITIQRQRRFLGRRLGNRARNGQDRVGAEAALVLAAVEIDHGSVDKRLLGNVKPHDRFADLGVDVLYRLGHALATVAVGIAIAQLDCLLGASRRARWYCGAAADPGFQNDIGFDRRVAARVENFASDDIDDCTHALTPSFVIVVR